ncbi:MAG: tripartite tricarboxylate transporter substrate binding protein [Limnohabitans sp.]|nr:tripartite tricarboxylate transporter substrate binding protein [Limnohabitans sp.]
MRHFNIGWTWMQAGLTALVCAISLGAAQAQEYPSRALTIVVPYGPGSYTDNVIRPVAQALTKVLGQPVIIDNRAGANGVIASQYVARAKPDGYTLLAGSSTTLAANVGLFKVLPYEPLRDFQAVAGVASTSMMLLVRSDAVTKDLKSFLTQAGQSASPMAMGYGSSSAQVALAQLARVSGAKFTGVPYKGTPQVITDLVGGQISAGIVDVSNGVPQVKAGKVLALAISAGRRSSAVPDVPTLSESYPGVQLLTWIGLVAPSGTPAAVVSKLEQAVTMALATPELKSQLASLSTDLEPMSHEEMARRMRQDQTQWVELIKAAGIQPE